MKKKKPQEHRAIEVIKEEVSRAQTDIELYERHMEWAYEEIAKNSELIDKAKERLVEYEEALAVLEAGL